MVMENAVTLFYPDGMTGIMNIKLNLKQMQELVGGYITTAPCNVEDHVLIVNEEGLLHNLPVNPSASDVAGMPIVGVAIMIHKDDFE